MTDKRLDKHAKLKRLQVRYIAELPDKVSVLQTAWNQLQADKDQDVARELCRQVHNLAGSAGTFGFSTLSEQARSLEKVLVQLQGEYDLDRGKQETITKALLEIDLLVQRGPELIYNTVEPQTGEQVTTTTAESHLVYVIEDDPMIAEEIKTQLRHFDYQVSVFPDSSSAAIAIKKQMPRAMIIDVFLPEGELAGPQFVKDSSLIQDADIPVVFISTRDDWDARLAAVRAGGDAYLRKPIDYSELFDRLEVLIAGAQVEPYRILVVDDMQLLAEHYALALREAGMQVEVLTELPKFFDVLNEFKPELILMDIFMPDCTGLEAAKIIRQKDELAGIPIVFLSTETDRQQQDAAMQLGADDFLQKPVADQQLITSVNLRVERFRKLRALMHLDSLTGLLNHVSIKLRLESEVARAIRNDSSMVFAMIDIDKFKMINDSYGHPMGDRVIKSLSRLLVQRLRKSDMVGRYGGEEFAVILPDTGIRDALSFMDSLRQQFAEIVHQHQGVQFSSTFSAGLVSLKSNFDESSLVRAADEALYQAKKGGRNQIVCAE
jgi:diguanylate cyclase (GGDEF)-like protein